MLISLKINNLRQSGFSKKNEMAIRCPLKAQFLNKLNIFAPFFMKRSNNKYT